MVSNSFLESSPVGKWSNLILIYRQLGRFQPPTFSEKYRFAASHQNFLGPHFFRQSHGDKNAKNAEELQPLTVSTNGNDGRIPVFVHKAGYIPESQRGAEFHPFNPCKDVRPEKRGFQSTEFPWCIIVFCWDFRWFIFALGVANIIATQKITGTLGNSPPNAGVRIRGQSPPRNAPKMSGLGIIQKVGLSNSCK